MLRSGKGLWRSSRFDTPAVGRDTCHQTRQPRAPSNLASNTARDGASTKLLLPCLTTLIIKNFFLICNPKPSPFSVSHYSVCCHWIPPQVDPGRAGPGPKGRGAARGARLSRWAALLLCTLSFSFSHPVPGYCSATGHLIFLHWCLSPNEHGCILSRSVSEFYVFLSWTGIIPVDCTRWFCHNCVGENKQTALSRVTVCSQ